MTPEDTAGDMVPIYFRQEGAEDTEDTRDGDGER